MPPTIPRPLWTLTLTGTLRLTEPGTPDPPQRVVQQRVRAGLGNLDGVRARNIQRRAHVIPYDPRTPIQLALRARIADAVAAWQALDPAARAPWAARGAPRHITGYMAYVSAWCADHPIAPPAPTVPTITTCDADPIRPLLGALSPASAPPGPYRIGLTSTITSP